MSQARDEQLINIRPVIASIDLSQNLKKEERFQSETLRPILKFQHALLHCVFNKWKTQQSLDSLSIDDQRHRIKRLLQNNVQLRNQLLGIVIGMMTIDESQYYIDNESDIRKRIISMLVERLMHV